MTTEVDIDVCGNKLTIVIEGWYGHPRFYGILAEMMELHSKKAHDYAGASSDPLNNFKEVARASGVMPSKIAFQFIATKFFRLANLLSLDSTAMNESIEDTLMDLAVYSVLMRILRGEEKKEP